MIGAHTHPTFASLPPPTASIRAAAPVCSHQHPFLPPHFFTLQSHGMFISDIPPHDMSSDFVVMAEQREVEAELAKRLEV